MEKKMSETEMENYLISINTDIFDEEKCIDSTKVIEEAIILGYSSELNEETEELEFTLE